MSNSFADVCLYVSCFALGQFGSAAYDLVQINENTLAEKSPAQVYDAVCNVKGAEVKGQASVKATFMREGKPLYPEITIETSPFKDANGSGLNFPEGTKCTYSRTVESVKKAAPAPKL
jgi:hypothetical protein